MMLRRYHVSEEVEKPQETVADTSGTEDDAQKTAKKTSKKKQGDVK